MKKLEQFWRENAVGIGLYFIDNDLRGGIIAQNPDEEGGVERWPGSPLGWPARKETRGEGILGDNPSSQVIIYKIMQKTPQEKLSLLTTMCMNTCVRMCFLNKYQSKLPRQRTASNSTLMDYETSFSSLMQ